MIILDKVEPIHYLILGIDFIVIFTFFYLTLKNLETMRMVGLLKAFLTVIVVWFIGKLLGLEMVTNVFGVMISYTFLAVIILFPDEFKKMLDNFGRRDIFIWNKDKLISKESRKELSKAVMELSRRREGALIVIARKSDMEEEIERGERLGQMKIDSNLIQELYKTNSYFSSGAMIIRDDEIVSTNVMLDMMRYDDLVRRGAGKRHLAGFWVAVERDCIAIIVSESTGKISIASTEKTGLEYQFALNTKEMDITNGLDEYELEKIINARLTGKNTHIFKDEVKKKETKKKKEKVKKDKPKKPKKEKTKKKKKEQKEEPVSKGFRE